MRHQLNLHPEPFNKIKLGHKTIEMRLNDERRKNIHAGDEIEFINRDNGQTLLCRVLKTKAFDSFEELYSFYNKEDLGYEKDDIADPNDMGMYYPLELRKKYGALAIKIQLIH